MDIVRSYRLEDRAACLSLFDTNSPRFFDSSERAGFEGFLDQMVWPYQVIERVDAQGRRRIVACGGHAVEPNGRTVSLCWGMVEQGLHRQGLGRMLTEARLAAARAVPRATDVRLDTGVHTTGFYERFGFVVEAVQPDGYAPGSDRYDMRLAL